MALFLSNIINRLDKKGRISVPSAFRHEIKGEAFQGVLLFQSGHYPCLEGFVLSTIEQINNRFDDLDVLSDKYDDWSTNVFGNAVPLPFDSGGRIILTASLIEHADLDEQVIFVGLGRKFQIWNPENFEKRKKEAREAAQSKKISLPTTGEGS